MRLVVSITLLALLAGCVGSRELETSVCGTFKEPFVFKVWSSIAGDPNPARAREVGNAEPVTFATKDGLHLRGYKLKSTAANGSITGRLLVAQGNAMLSDQLVSSLTGFSDAGLEVYIFDYRGYGASDGKRRLKAIVNDYEEMVHELIAPAEGKRLLYGISFGGIVMLNAIGAGAEYDRAVIDSSPSRISLFGCPARYDPVLNVPGDASRLLLIAGEKDAVVPVRSSEELRTRGVELGARTEVRAEYAHPFMDPDIEVRQSRMDLIRSFLLD